MGKPVPDRAGAARCGLAALALIASAPALADEPVVVGVEIERSGADTYKVAVTVRHGDEGWDHYANRWVVLDENGQVLGERILAHPHVDEQPFTRSMTLSIPVGATRVRVRSRDSVHGEGPPSAWIEVPD